MATKRDVERPDGSRVRCYAPGDGHLSFALEYAGRATGCSTITADEARAACPYGWVIYQDGPYWRARPAK